MFHIKKGPWTRETVNTSSAPSNNITYFTIPPYKTVARNKRTAFQLAFTLTENVYTLSAICLSMCVCAPCHAKLYTFKRPSTERETERKSEKKMKKKKHNNIERPLESIHGIEENVYCIWNNKKW